MTLAQQQPRSLTGPALQKQLVALGIPDIHKVTRQRHTGHHIVDFQRKPIDGKIDASYQLDPIDQYAALIASKVHVTIHTVQETVTDWREDKNEHIRYEGYITLSHHGAGGKQKFKRKGKHVCPQCLKKMEWDEKEEHLLSHHKEKPPGSSTPPKNQNETNTLTNGKVSALPTKDSPKQSQNQETTNIVGEQHAAPNNLTVKKDQELTSFITPDDNTQTLSLHNNLAQFPDKIQSRTTVPQFKIDDVVWVNGYADCVIKSNRIQRTIVAVRVMQSGVFYKFATGTNSTGISYHHYPEHRLTLISRAVAPATPPAPPNNDDKPKCKIIHLRDFNIRTRPYTHHPKLTRLSCRTRPQSTKGAIHVTN